MKAAAEEPPHYCYSGKRRRPSRCLSLLLGYRGKKRYPSRCPSLLLRFDHHSMFILLKKAKTNYVYMCGEVSTNQLVGVQSRRAWSTKSCIPLTGTGYRAWGTWASMSLPVLLSPAVDVQPRGDRCHRE